MTNDSVNNTRTLYIQVNYFDCNNPLEMLRGYAFTLFPCLSKKSFIKKCLKDIYKKMFTSGICH